ncbi:DNA repair protein RecO [uncultured Planktosalinus sp.]|uniref:DNA repair protein RecO n=1 Tax=uncultured Planktosalinus sp. TaxID=1810935 RepID=UPI0030DA5F48
MLVNTKALVISTVKYAEADLIVKCFTKSSGIKSYMLKGVLKSKKGKLRASYFQPLSLLEITAFHKNKGSLEYLKEVKVDYPFKSLHNNVVKSSLVLFLSEVLKQSIIEEEPNESLYSFLEEAFKWLDENESYANFHILFLLKLTEFLGFSPDASTINKPIFNPVEGVFQHDISNIYCVEITPENKGITHLFGIKFDEIKTLKLTKKQRQNTLDILLLYFELHIQGFKKPKSLAVLHQIFN